ncbi:hypothetical protein A2721_01820 [Candidatus Gottesmanbacteria bacterium RIFCSPHIGHO2_01_FULL_47_48]|uniref:PIN domain-containing protein n=1 Tax=Candidatus Gottesmanbacteria bacterium RIFCSPHIGHO2_01_FULL_47_48 TaxID=1798381 RepID=A0A1F6A1I4_9BACT|nr:MAG: hypothetical protein A2721_01820 [Candidatus Gottesmanbacteria bacterium RIFCSPHIGHO2_01_FULL_47_48]
MRKLVVDASVCLKWVFEEEDSEKARELLVKQAEGEALLLAPSIWEFEVVNGFASAILRRKVTFPLAKKLFKEILAAKPQIIQVPDLLEKCLENSRRWEISAYDSAYVTLATENGIVLVSSDARLVRKVKSASVVLLKELVWK